MKHVLILNYKSGLKAEVIWGSIPPEWHVPVYEGLEFAADKGFDNLTSHSTTTAKKTFVLIGVKRTGFLWWKVKYGIYEEETSHKPSISGTQTPSLEEDHCQAETDCRTADTGSGMEGTQSEPERTAPDA